MVDQGSIGTESLGSGKKQDALPTAVLQTAAAAARGRIADLQNQITELRREALELEAEERLLTKLLAVRRGEVPEWAGKVEAQTPATQPVRESRHEAVGEVVAILEEAGRPVHVSELMRLLGERKVAIPGAGTQANLISHMSRDPRIVRPSRGMYGLESWGLEDMPKRARKKKTRRRTTTIRTTTN